MIKGHTKCHTIQCRIMFQIRINDSSIESNQRRAITWESFQGYKKIKIKFSTGFIHKHGTSHAEYKSR